MSLMLHMSVGRNIGILELQVLWLLSKKPSHGYALMKELDALKTTHIAQGTLYPVLARLKQKKLVKSKRVSNKRVYSLTAEGRKVMKKNARDLVSVFSGIIGDFYCSCCGRVEK